MMFGVWLAACRHEGTADTATTLTGDSATLTSSVCDGLPDPAPTSVWRPSGEWWWRSGFSLAIHSPFVVVGAPDLEYATSHVTVLAVDGLTELGNWGTHDLADGFGYTVAVSPSGAIAAGAFNGRVTSTSGGAVYILDPASPNGLAEDEAIALLLGGAPREGGFGLAVAWDDANNLVVGTPGAETLHWYDGSVLAGTVTTDDAAYVTSTAEFGFPERGLGQALTVWDWDSDGRREILAGASLSLAGLTPAVLLLSDAAEAAPQLIGAWTAPAEDLTAGFGLAVSGLDDLDGDGSNDAALPAFTRNLTATSGQPTTREGAVYLVPGGTDSFGPAEDLPTTVLGVEFGAGLGKDTTSADMNLDGQADLVVGVSRVTDPTLAAGSVLVFDGPLPPGTLTADDADLFLVGGAPDDGFGWALAADPATGTLLVGAPLQCDGRVYAFGAGP